MKKTAFILGLSILAIFLWAHFQPQRSVISHEEFTTVLDVKNTIQKPTRFPKPMEPKTEHEFQVVSNEIIAAFLVQKAAIDWTNLWYSAEAGKGDTKSLEALTRVAKTNYNKEVRSVFLRIITNTNYSTVYRQHALAWYSVVYEDEFDGKGISAIITSLNDPSQDIRRAAAQTLSYYVNDPSMLPYLPLLENTFVAQQGDQWTWQSVSNFVIAIKKQRDKPKVP